MKTFLISVLKLGLAIIYAPLKLFRTKDQIVYLSRQSNSKSIDMKLLEQALIEANPNVKQVFRLRMIDDGLVAKIKYAFGILGDMYFIATSRVAIVDTYSITVSCLKHKKSLKVIQIWHALGATKKFGLQCLGTKEGRDEKVSRAMNMHKNYDYVLAPSMATSKFYLEAFGVDESKIKILPMPRVDFITDNNARVDEFYANNPHLVGKKIVLYVPTFREREAEAADMLKCAMKGKDDFALVISPHPLSKVGADKDYLANGGFSSFDLMKVADVIITDYSACAFEASLLLKPLYFYVPDYDEYMLERGINVNVFDEMPSAVFKDANALAESITSSGYNMDELVAFKQKFIENSDGSNSARLADFVLSLMK